MTSTPEYWFTIGREPNENGYGLHPYLTAHVRAAEPTSIYDQLMAVHREEPAAQDGLTIQKPIKIQISDFTEMTCPDLKDQLRKLKSLPIRLPEINGDYVIIHPMIHAFLIDGANGDVLMSLTDDNNPLVLWAQETRRALDACRKIHAQPTGQ